MRYISLFRFQHFVHNFLRFFNQSLCFKFLAAYSYRNILFNSHVTVSEERRDQVTKYGTGTKLKKLYYVISLFFSPWGIRRRLNEDPDAVLRFLNLETNSQLSTSQSIRLGRRGMRFTVSNTVPYPVPIAAVYYEGKLSENFPCQFELGMKLFLSLSQDHYPYR